MGLVSFLGRAYRVLLRVTPAVPCPLDCALDQLQPFFVHVAAGRRWQREQLPKAVLANQRDDGLPAGPPGVPVRPRMLWVGRHQSLLNGKDQVMRGVEGRRGERRIGAAEACLQQADPFTQQVRYLDVVVEKAIGLRHERAAPLLNLIAIHSRDGCSGHPRAP